MNTVISRFAGALLGISILVTGLAGTAQPATAGEQLAQASGGAKSPWLVRLRGIAVVPNEDASMSPLAVDPDIDTAYVPELDISYFLTDNFALELILATANHNVDANVAGVGNVDLGDVWLLPPTLTAQYHFLPHGQVRPYVGAGVNYTVFYGDDQPTGIDVDYENSFGWVLQAGVDIAIDDRWAINLDVKRLWLDTDVTVNTPLGNLTGEVDIDPWIFGIGIAYRF